MVTRRAPAGHAQQPDGAVGTTCVGGTCHVDGVRIDTHAISEHLWEQLQHRLNGQLPPAALSDSAAGGASGTARRASQ
jgi:hypothetical protein